MEYLKINSKFQLPEKVFVNNIGCWLTMKRENNYFYHPEDSIDIAQFAQIKPYNKNQTIVPQLKIESRLFERKFGEFYLPFFSTNNDVAQLFDTIFLNYNECITLDLNKFIISTLLGYICDKNRNKGIVKVLDYGIGTGLSVDIIKNQFNEKNIELSGIDISKKMVELCKEKGINVEQYRGIPLNYSNNFFDGIFLSFVIHYFQDIQLNAMFKEFYRLLQTGGTLTFNVHPPTPLMVNKYTHILRESGFSNIIRTSKNTIINKTKYDSQFIMAEKVY